MRVLVNGIGVSDKWLMVTCRTVASTSPTRSALLLLPATSSRLPLP